MKVRIEPRITVAGFSKAKARASYQTPRPPFTLSPQMILTKTSLPPRPARDAAPVILYVENNPFVACLVSDVLELAGWRAQVCTNFSNAVARLRLADHYDLAVIDKELPAFDGLDIVRDARRQPQRKRTPIIVVSLDDCAEEARLAGADACLRKPQDLLLLVETIRRLLGARGV